MSTEPDTVNSDAVNIVELKNVSRFFGTTPAINNISLTVKRGEILGIIGRSGAGKSTLIRCINGLEKPNSGSIRIEGREISHLTESQLQPMRRRVGMVFQHFNLLSAKTIADNIALPLKIAGQNPQQRKKRVAELLELVNLADKAKYYPSQLSGGQKQRIGIARSLAAKPALLLSDEATSALDPETTLSILELLKNINQQLGLTILLITHEMDVIRHIADRVIVLDKGTIVEQGPVWQVFANPSAPTTQSLLQVLTPQLPATIAARLSPIPADDVVLRVKISGDAAKRPIFNDLTYATGVTAHLLHGNMDTIQGEPIGTLFLQISAKDQTRLKAAIDYLSQNTDATEVLGYVASNA